MEHSPLKDELIDALEMYFQERQDISMAFLFGSQVSDRVGPHSDWDVAIYFKSVSNELEWEVAKFYPQENRIWQDLEKILKREVDMLVLNRVPSSIVFTILNSGLPLIIRNRDVYLNLLNIVSYEAIDFMDFCSDFYRIKQMARSLTREDKTRLLEIVDFLAGEAEDFEKFRNLSWQEYQGQRSKRREVERWIENIVNASLDIAKIILASQKMNIPTTYQEALRLLGATDMFNSTFADRFSQWARLRNVLAHRYLDLKWEQINRFIQEASKDTFYFIEKIKGVCSI